jgi:hypothetical protein
MRSPRPHRPQQPADLLAQRDRQLSTGLQSLAQLVLQRRLSLRRLKRLALSPGKPLEEACHELVAGTAEQAHAAAHHRRRRPSADQRGNDRP